MKLYSYVVSRDYGFAPNPFFGICTLATCKPEIRRSAQVNDWIIGTGGVANSRSGILVFAMKVTDITTFDEYWSNPKYARKKPFLFGSEKLAYGDNIYHKRCDGTWSQENSHHSNEDGSPNRSNIDHDTKVDRVLVSQFYKYWGGTGPIIPMHLRCPEEIVAKRGHRCQFTDTTVQNVVKWIRSLEGEGYIYKPTNWK